MRTTFRPKFLEISEIMDIGALLWIFLIFLVIHFTILLLSDSLLHDRFVPEVLLTYDVTASSA
jgi:hypothetical protein